MLHHSKFLKSLFHSFHFKLSFSRRFFSSSTSLAYQPTENSILLKRQKRKPDRFGIIKCSSIERLWDLFQTPKYTLTLNENILICYQITQLAPIHVLQSIYGLSEILPKIQFQISDVNLIDEDPLVGSLIYSLKALNCYSKIENWVHLLDLIMADCFDPEADEVLKAMQGCDGLEGFLTEDWQRELFSSAFLKIEMLVVEGLKQMKYNIENLGDVCRIMIKNGKVNMEVFEEIEYQLMKYINGERKMGENEENHRFTVNEMINFSYFFAIADYFAPNLFIFTNNLLLAEIRKNETSTFKGSEIANLMYFWQFYKQKEISFELDDEIKKWTFRKSLDSDIFYNIEELISMHQGIHLLDINAEKLLLLTKHFENKLLKIDTSSISQLNLSHIEKYFKLRAEMEFENDYNRLPNEVYRFFDDLCSQIFERFHYISVLDFFLMLEKSAILNRFPSFFSILPKFIEKYSFQYDFEDICYFYLLFISNISLLQEEKSGEFYNALNNLKEFIKFVALRRGFKMDLDSNFHKLLSAIDLAHFFDGGDG